MTRSRLPICPECGEPNPRPRTGGIGQKRTHSAQHDYRCVNTDCGHEFDSWELEHRPPKRARDPTNSEDAMALLDADPDIVTDGGLDIDSPTRQFDTGSDREWRCPECGHRTERHHASRTRPICEPCEWQHAVVLEMVPFYDGERVELGDDLVTDGGREPDREPQAFVVRCTDCDFESATQQRRATARKIAEGHERQAHDGRPAASIDAVEYVADGGVRYETVDGEIGGGDVVVDLASGKALQVVSQSARTAGEHEQTRSDPTAELFGADPDEPVYNCVFLPDGEKITPPTKTYAYPESRLLRYPVERATDGVDLQTHLWAAFLEQLLDGATTSEVETVFALVRRAHGDDTAALLEELVDVETPDLATDGGRPAATRTDEHGQLHSADGMPGTSAADGSAIHPAAAHFQQAADLVQGGDPDGARHAARQALQILEAER